MNRKGLKSLLSSSWGGKLVALAAIFIIMAIFSRNFFTLGNWKSILLAISIYGIMACGMLLCVLVGCMDFSVGSTAAFAAAVVAKLYIETGWKPHMFAVGIIVAMLGCAALGLLHTLLVVKIKINPFVATLATKYMMLGLAILILNQRNSYVDHKDTVLYAMGNARFLGVPMPTVIFIIVAIVIAIVLNCTVFGRQLYAVGGNPRATNFLGISSTAKTCVTFVICSCLAGLAGIILSSMNAMASSGTASGYEGSVLTAMCVGGVTLTGGAGGVIDAVYGALLVGIINNAMILLGVPSEWQTFVQGVIIVVAIVINEGTRARAMKTLGAGADSKKEKKEAA